MLDSVINAIETVIYAIGESFTVANAIKGVIFGILGFLTFHHIFYNILGFFSTRKFKKTENKHKYAICIAARNEETVIGNLIASINNQDYPKDKLTVFVVADNCTDSTAQVSRDLGAVCYERFDSVHKTKGFALQFLFKNIEKDYGTDSFEGYFIFDADNLLNSDYITRMNEAFDSGEKIITSYRNTKNFDENWIASTYALHWIRSIRYKHRPRSVLRLATNIQGTGFLFASELVKNGWNYTSLTEDRAFTADAVAMGYPISYCDAAMFYDEQPTSLRIALRQRLRWSKGHLMAFTETGPSLIRNIFVGPRYRKEGKPDNPKVAYHCKKRPETFGKRLLEQIRFRWASFDTFGQLCPRAVFKVAAWLIVSVFIYFCCKYTQGFQSSLFTPKASTPFFWDVIFGIPFLSGIEGFCLDVLNFYQHMASVILEFIFGSISVNLGPGIEAGLMAALFSITWNAVGKINYHIGSMITPIYIFLVEHKRIIKIPLYKKALFCFTWPVFDIIGRWTTYLALFMKVEWKPIPHTSTVTIEQIEKATEDNVNGKDKVELSASKTDKQG